MVRFNRYISFILAVLILVLSCIPCSDVVAVHTEHPSTSIVKQSVPHGICDDGDFCSPFCQCSCCAGFALPTDCRMELVETVVYIDRPCTLYLHPAIKGVYFPIWQPPQLA